MVLKKNRRAEEDEEEIVLKPDPIPLNISARYISQANPRFAHNGKDCLIIEKEELCWWVKFEGDSYLYMCLPEEVAVKKEAK